MSKSIETITVANVIYGIDGDGYSYDAVNKVMSVAGDVQCSDGDDGTLSMQGLAQTVSTIGSTVAGKADLVESATSGNFAGLDESGNLTDSGKKASDFMPATTIDNSPTYNSNNLVKSGGVYAYVQNSACLSYSPGVFMIEISRTDSGFPMDDDTKGRLYPMIVDLCQNIYTPKIVAVQVTLYDNRTAPTGATTVSTIGLMYCYGSETQGGLRICFGGTTLSADYRKLEGEEDVTWDSTWTKQTSTILE